ncbi:MAG: universal stress protein [Candidatus Acidiferrales bacterium]
MKILVAIDGTHTSQSVVRAVTARPWPPGSDLFVISVVDPFMNVKVTGLMAEATAAARATVEAAGEKLRTTGFTVSGAVMQGHPPTCIVAEAINYGADLVLVGSHGNPAITRFLLGSTALAVTRNAPCSVEIVRPPAKDQEHKAPERFRILLATDGSKCSELAARSVAERPWPEGTQVRVVCVCDFSAPLVGNQAPGPEVCETLREIQISEVKEALAATSKILHESHLETQDLIPNDINPPKTVILGEATNWHSDLIVVGSHGRRGLDRLLLGSVSEAVAMYAHCSVEVIRSHKDQSCR